MDSRARRRNRSRRLNPAAEQDAAVAAGDATGVRGRGGRARRDPVAPKDLGLLKEVLEALVFVHRGILPPKTVREVLGEEFTAEEIAAGVCGAAGRSTRGAAAR